MDETHICDVIKLYRELNVNIHKQCDITLNKSQYAAIDTYINNLELPLISDESLCASRSNSLFCIKHDDALKLSIIAIIGTYTNVNNIIFFTSDNRDMSLFLKSISNIRSRRYPGSVISIHMVKQNDTFRITSYDTGISQVVCESNMISIASHLINNSKSMTFYLNPDSLFYSSYMHNNTDSIWISRISNSIQLAGDSGSEFMPILYDNICTDNVLRLNFGKGQVKTQRLNIIESQIHAVNSSIMSAVSKDNLCYCCAYMKRIHSLLCESKSSNDISFETELLTNFTED